MKAQQLRTIIIQHADPVNVQAALDKLRNGKALTAGDSGVVAYDPIQNLDFVAVAPLFYDGQRYTQALYVSAN